LIKGTVSIPVPKHANADSTQSLDIEILPSEIYGALDSGSSLIVIPASQYSVAMRSMLGDNVQKKQCMVKEGTFFCLCSAKINPLVFDFATREGSVLHVELTDDDLFTVVGYNGFDKHQTICRVNIMSSSNVPLWILGDVFLRRVYVIHDLKEAKGKLVPQLHLFVPGDSYIDTVTQANPLIDVFSVLAVLGCLLALWYCCSYGPVAATKKKPNDQSAYTLLAA